jgi:PAS domain S-box-containing protein
VTTAPFRLAQRLGPYGVAVGFVALAIFLQRGLAPIWAEDLPALLFYPAVVLSAGYGGLGPGLLATALSGLAISYYWLPPRYSFAVSDLSDLLGLVIFLAVGLLISVINERQLRHATAVLAALRKSEQRYRLLFQLNPAGMFQSQRDGQLLECNDAFVRLLGLSSREKALSHNLREFYVNPQGRDDPMARLRPGETTANQELQWRRSDGTPLSVLLNIRQDEDGVLDGLVVEMPGRGSGRRV